MPCGALLFHADGADLRRTCGAKFCVFRGFCVQWYFWHKYWIGASKTRAKITIFQTTVFQLFIILLYRRTKGHIFLLTQRRKVSQSVCVVLRRLRAIIFTRNPQNPQKSLHVFARIYSYFFCATNGHEFSLMPCGVELFHADGADLRRSMRSKFCVFLWVLCATFLTQEQKDITLRALCAFAWEFFRVDTCKYVEPILCHSVSSVCNFLT